MKTTIKDYFTFSQRDIKGIFWLLFLLLLLIIFRISRHWLPPFERDYSEEISALILDLETRRDSLSRANFQDYQSDEFNQESISPAKKVSKNIRKSTKDPILPFPEKSELFFFNPNFLDPLGWVRLGFSERQVNVIMNFREKGGVFYEKEDVASLYCVDENKYSELEPWIRIEEAKRMKLDLNSSDTSELKSLKGIGSYYASKIVEHRDALGGYNDFQQLFEIWKMRPETVKLLQERCELGSRVLRKIKINQVSSEDLKSHPYLDWKLANAIVNYRDHHGAYESWKDLDQIRLMDEETKTKLKPYIAFDD